MNTAPEMKIKALAPWFGGKRTLAPAIVEELGDHTQYFEPFAGGISIILAKPKSQKETVCDLHGDITNLARVISIEASAVQLYLRLSSLVFAEGLLQDARAYLEANEIPGREPPGVWTPSMLDRAYWFFLASWMGRNGTAGTQRLDYQIAVRWTNSGGSPCIRFANAVQSMPAWHERLKNVVVLTRDAFTIIPKFEDAKGTAIYADPPYAAETRTSHDNRDGGKGRYLHEFDHAGGGLFHGDDHTRLATMLRAFKHARVVVSAYDCERYRQLYAGWTFVKKTMPKLLHQQNGRSTPKLDAPEVLIINGPSLAPMSAVECVATNGAAP